MGHLPPWLVLAMMALTPPAALALETALRWALFPPDFEQLRVYLGPSLTPVAWGLAAAVPVLAVVGRWAQRRVAAWWRVRHPHDPNAALAGLYLGASLPQLGALAATGLYTFGAALAPVALSAGLATVAVLALGVGATGSPASRGGGR